MNKLFHIIISIVLLAACQAPQGDDLASKKALLAEKKTQIKDLQNEIDQLQSEILKLDPPKEKAPVLVRAMAVEANDFQRFTDVQASVMSDDVVYASSEIGGRLTSLKVGEGQYVKRGQLIATVDVQTLQDQKAELETSMNLAKDVYDRQKRLWDQNLGTEIQFLQAQNNYERLEKSLALLNTQLAKANVYAPISGVVDKEFLQSGEMAAPGAPIIQLFNPNDLKVVADVPESYLGKIDRGDKVRIEFPAIGEEVTKSVSLVGRTIDPSNRTFKIEVNTHNMNGKLKPNLLAEIAFNDYSKKDAIVVDLPLVQEEVNGSKYIYVVGTEGSKKLAKKAYVTIGESSQGRVIIEEGLKPGDQIITEGARSVSNGATIELMSK